MGAFEKVVSKNGGKLVAFYYTMGSHDGVAIVESPSEESFLKTVLTVGSLGNIRTTTLKAWPTAEMAKIINQT